MDTRSVAVELLKRPIAYHAIMAKAFESVNLAVMVGQLYYWTPRADDPNGWIYKSAADMFDETGLTRRQQDTARDLGTELGVIYAEVRGTPPVMHYKVNIDRLVEVLQDYLTTKNTGTLFPAAVVLAEQTPGAKARLFFTDETVRAGYIQTIKEFPAFKGHEAAIEAEMKKFVAYWTEPSKSGKKMRWEMQSTFEVTRRITTWLNNAIKFNSKPKTKTRQGMTI